MPDTLTRADLARIAEALHGIVEAVKLCEPGDGVVDVTNDPDYPAGSTVRLTYEHSIEKLLRRTEDAIATLRSPPPAGETERGATFVADPATVAVVKAGLKKVYDEINDNRVKAKKDGCDKCDATLSCALMALDDFDDWFRRVEPPAAPSGDAADWQARCEADEKALAERTAERDQLRGELAKRTEELASTTKALETERSARIDTEGELAKRTEELASIAAELPGASDPRIDVPLTVRQLVIDMQEAVKVRDIAVRDETLMVEANRKLDERLAQIIDVARGVR